MLPSFGELGWLDIIVDGVMQETAEQHPTQP